MRWVPALQKDKRRVVVEQVCGLNRGGHENKDGDQGGKAPVHHFEEVVEDEGQRCVAQLCDDSRDKPQSIEQRVL
jgi:hypothetical protein